MQDTTCRKQDNQSHRVDAGWYAALACVQLCIMSEANPTEWTDVGKQPADIGPAPNTVKITTTAMEATKDMQHAAHAIRRDTRHLDTTPHHTRSLGAVATQKYGCRLHTGRYSPTEHLALL